MSTSLGNLIIVYFASKFAKNGGHVRLQNYLAMPHVFQVFEKHPSARTSFREFTNFVQEVTSGKIIDTQMNAVNGKGIFEDEPLDLDQYPITFTKKKHFDH